MKFYKIAEELKENSPNLTDYQLYSLAIQIERNQIIEKGLNVSYNDSHPSSLEAIAMALGVTDSIGSRTITDVLRER